MGKNTINRTAIFIILIFSPFLLSPDKPAEGIEKIEKQLETPTITRGEKLRLLTLLCRLTQDSKPEKAVKYGKEALEILRQFKDPSLETRVLLSLTRATRNTGEHETALKYGHKAKTLALEIDDKKAAAIAYNHIARVCHHLGFLDRSLDYALRAMKSSVELDDQKNFAEAYENIGNVYMSLKDNKQAMIQYQKSLYILEELGDKKSIALVLIDIGNVYHASRQYKKALSYYRESLTISEGLNWQLSGAAALGGIAAVYSAAGNPARGLENNLKALESCKDTGQKRIIAVLLGNTGACYRKLGQYEKALPYVNQALDIAEKIKNKDIISNLYRELFEIYLALKDHQQAYVYFNKSKTIENEIYSEECRKNISELWRREREILQLMHNNSIQKLKLEHQELVRNFLILVSLLALVLAGVIYNRYRTKKRAERLLKESERKLRTMNTAKDKLFSIIAHDLESPLNGLLLSSDYLEKNYNAMGEERIKELLHHIYENTNHMAKLLDNLLQWAVSQLGKLEVAPETLDLKRLTEDTIGLMGPPAMEKNIRLLSFIKKDTLAWADKRMVETILRNLVSNAVKYTGPGGKVHISSESGGTFLEITVSDTGVGIPAGKLNTLFNLGVHNSTRGTAGEKGVGLGLVLCKEFVEKNGGAIRVETNNKKKTPVGTRIVFTLPAAHAAEWETVIPQASTVNR